MWSVIIIALMLIITLCAYLVYVTFDLQASFPHKFSDRTFDLQSFYECVGSYTEKLNKYDRENGHAFICFRGKKESKGETERGFQCMRQERRLRGTAPWGPHYVVSLHQPMLSVVAAPVWWSRETGREVMMQ